MKPAHQHDPSCNVMVPIQNEFRPDHGDLAGAPWPLAVPLWIAEEAFVVYHSRYPDQSLESINRRSGFGSRELLDFLAGGTGDGAMLNRRAELLDTRPRTKERL